VSSTSHVEKLHDDIVVWTLMVSFVAVRVFERDTRRVLIAMISSPEFR